MRRCFTQSLALWLIACARADSGGAPVAVDDADAGSGAALPGGAEWLALTGPRAGVHEVYDAACGGERFAHEYRIMPSVSCAVRRDAAGLIIPGTRDCSVSDYCSSSADCTQQPGGVCSGAASSRCEYAELGEPVPCERDADCSALPGGSCALQVEGGGQLCYPTGECRTTPVRACSYPALGQPCATDADCTAAPGGTCRLAIISSACVYNECDDAEDCGPAARCACYGTRRCIPSSCAADGDCADGYRCEPSLALVCGNFNPPAGYHCHAAADECQSDADCDGVSCVFDAAVARWLCLDVRCFD